MSKLIPLIIRLGELLDYSFGVLWQLMIRTYSLIIPPWPTITEYTSLPLESHKNRSLFLKHARDIGKAYKNQALELISICQLLSRIASPKCVHEDAELRRELPFTPFALPPMTFSCRAFRMCDIALRSAADSGAKVTEEADARFKEATKVLSSYSERTQLL